MNPDQLHPEIRDTIAKLPRLPFASRFLLPLAAMGYNFASRSRVSDGVQVHKTKAGGIDTLVYEAASGSNGAGLFWIYGGGYVAGKPEHLNALASIFALQTGARVFVPTYRLAPKHPFPAALQDMQQAWNWLVDHADDHGVDTKRLAVGGNSAGGGLAASLVQWIHDQAGVQPCAQALFYPMLDDRVAADRSRDEINHFIWNNKANHVAWSAYLAPNQPGSDGLPDYAAAARRDDLGGLPRTWIGQCSLDLFAQEDADYARRLQDAEVECHLHQVEGVPHAFEAICPGADVSKTFIASAVEFLNQSLGPKDETKIS